MSLPDKNPSMVNRLGHARLEHQSLKASLKKVLHSQRQNIIELVLTLIQKPISVHSSKKGLSLKNSTRVLLIEGEKHPCIVSDAAQYVLNPPQLSFTSETVFSHQLQLSIETLLFIRTPRFLKCLTICNFYGSNPVSTRSMDQTSPQSCKKPLMIHRFT